MAEVLWADYAYPGVDLTGYAGVVRYLQTSNGSTRSKYDLTAEEVGQHHAAGRPVGLFWQDGASSAGLGYDRGVSDARRADAAADTLGAPAVPVHFAVDDGTLTGPMVRPYFQGLLDTLRRPVGAYGSFAVCEYLATELGLPWLIQTSSWSAGQVSPRAWLLQRDHNVVSGTSKIDRDLLLRDLPEAAWQPPGDHTMAAPPTPAQLEAAGRRAAARAGVAFVVYSGAAGRCRCCSGSHNPAGPFIRAWGPYIGVIRHITAGGLGSRSMETYCRDILINDPAVPFKCQFSTAPNGDIWWLGSGRANHDLNMSQAAHDALVNGAMSLTEFCQNLRGSALVGSVHTIGIEQVAAVAPAAVQARATDYLVAELCRIPGWSGVDQAGHGEVGSDRGPGDPNEDMGAARVRSKALVAGTQPAEEQDMDATQDTALRRVSDEVHYIFANEVPLMKKVQADARAQQIVMAASLAAIANDKDITPEQLDAALDRAVAKIPPPVVDAEALTQALAAHADELGEAIAAHLDGVDAAQIKDAVREGLSGLSFSGTVSTPTDPAPALRDAAPAAPADDVAPRTSEAESDAFEGNDVPEADTLTEREAKARGLDQG